MEKPTPDATGASLLEGAMSLEFLLEPIMAETAAARESRTVRIDPVVARSLYDSLREHGARSEGEERQSCDDAFHFRSPLFDWNCALDVG
jgi:hypothetical protein